MDEEEVVAVIYHETDGAWYPHSIQTRKPRRKWVAPGHNSEHYDASYSKANGCVYIHKSGTGGEGNRVFLCRYAEPEKMPGRVWLHPEARLMIWDENAKREVQAGREVLASKGYMLLKELPGDPFADTCEGDTMWCDACGDNIPYDDTFLCEMCRDRAHEHGVGQGVCDSCIKVMSKPAKHHYRRAHSLTPLGHLLLKKLAKKAGKSCSGLLEEMIAAEAEFEGVEVTPAEVEEFKARRRAKQG